MEAVLVLVTLVVCAAMVVGLYWYAVRYVHRSPLGNWPLGSEVWERGQGRASAREQQPKSDPPREIGPDYHAVLGVRSGASRREIKHAFHRLAREYHPDATGNDPVAVERYKQISEAYAALGRSRGR